MKNLIKGNENGFTMIEALIGMAVFAIGILALAGLQISYIDGNASARMQTEATASASLMLEQLRSLSYDHANLDPGNHLAPAGALGPYNVAWQVSNDTPVNNTKTVNVVVTPLNQRNGRPVNLTTIIAE
jgi:prepilin-type N-terminal cleavage/methylation domain-containing protein